MSAALSQRMNVTIAAGTTRNLAKVTSAQENRPRATCCPGKVSPRRRRDSHARKRGKGDEDRMGKGVEDNPKRAKRGGCEPAVAQSHDRDQRRERRNEDQIRREVTAETIRL